RRFRLRLEQRARHRRQQRHLHERGRLALAAGESDFRAREGTGRSAPDPHGETAKRSHPVLGVRRSRADLHHRHLQLVEEAVDVRGLKSTLALLVVLIGLGGYIYFVLAKKPDSSVTKQEKLFPALESSKIDDITVKSESGDVTSLKKDSGTWKIVSPIQVTAADQDP